jgi:dolichyl-phosphate beta-glucosyltransferase
MNTQTTDEFTALIVPCYNEQHHLDATQYVDFSNRNPNFRLIFVDDGSQDRTVELLEGIQQAMEHDRVWILRLPQHRGRSEAIRRGVLLALSTPFLRSQDLGFIGVLDTRLDNPLNEINNTVLSMAGRDEIEVLVLKRRAMHGHAIEEGFVRRSIHTALSFVAIHAIELPINDIQSRVALLRYGRWLESVFSREFTHRSDCDLEILARTKNELGCVASSKIAEHCVEALELNDRTNPSMWEHLRTLWQFGRLVLNHQVRWQAASVVFEESECLQGLVMPIASPSRPEIRQPRIFNPDNSMESMGDSSETANLSKNHRNAA